MKRKYNNKINDKKIQNIIKSITYGLIELHNNNIIHRDLKPSNILICYNNQIKLSDFGISKIKEGQLAAFTKIGTPYYMSPETLNKNGYSYPVDYWALGCIFFELLTFKKPFTGNSIYALYLKIKKGNYNKNIIPEKYNNIVDGLLRYSPSKRYNGTKVIEFIENNNSKQNLIKNNLYPNKKYKINLNEKNYNINQIKKYKLNPIKKKYKLDPIRRNHNLNHIKKNYKLDPIKKLKSNKRNNYNLNNNFIQNKKYKKDFIKINIANIKKYNKKYNHVKLPKIGNL